MKTSLPVLLLGLLVTAGCQTASEVPPPKSAVHATRDIVYPISIGTSHYVYKDPFEIEAMSVEGDTLTITVTYAGGHELHEFALHGLQTVLESMPPQMTFTLTHNARNDQAEALIRHPLRFDLTAVKKHCEKVYGEGSVRQMLLRVVKAGDDSIFLPLAEYQF